MKDIPIRIDSFWTNAQRQSNSLHEFPYRACFKPQLPKFFIEMFCQPRSTILDPFMGRGTTIIESALMGHNAIGRDINPLSVAITEPRLRPPSLDSIAVRLDQLLSLRGVIENEDLLAFFDEEILASLYGLRQYFLEKAPDSIDSWIRMVILARLTGHSAGFLSKYTLPPNLCASVERQKKINEKYSSKNKKPKNIRSVILSKSKSFLKDLTDQCASNLALGKHDLKVGDSRSLEVEDGCVDLVVTSPPFLDIVDYQQDNWLRMWFLGQNQPDITMESSIEKWCIFIKETLRELKRVLKESGVIVFEVGDVKKTSLDERVVEAALSEGLAVKSIMINSQGFTKTSNIYGIKNGELGTNTNRIVVCQRS